MVELRIACALVMLVAMRAHATVRETVLSLLERRASGATICPSEVAKTLAVDAGQADWRSEMARVHEAVAQMVAEGVVRSSWKGAARAVGAGPYRISKPASRTDLS